MDERPGIVRVGHVLCPSCTAAQPVPPTVEWSERYRRSLGFTGGQLDARKAADQLRKLVGPAPVAMDNCYIVVARGELLLLAQIIEHSTDVAYAPLPGCA